MKKLSLYITIAAALLIIAAMHSCKHHESEYDDLSWVDTTIGGNGGNTSGSMITIMEKPTSALSELGTQTHLIFKTGDTWEINVAQEVQQWLKLSTTKGDQGKSIVSLTLQPNEGYDERNAAITIMSGGEQKTITITQKQTDAIIATSNKIEVEAEGATIEVEIRANVAYMQEIAQSAQSWIIPATSKALTSKILKYTIPENKSTSPRQGVIKFTGYKTGETVTVYQKGTCESLVISGSSFHMPQEGGEFKIEVLSNSQYNIKDPAVDWMRRIAQKNESSYTLYYQVSENKVTDTRECYIVVSSHDLSLKDTVYITQDPFVEKLSVTSEKELTMDKSANDVTISLSANTGYTIEMPEWIKGPKEAEAGDNEHKFAIDVNSDYEDRTGFITFTNLSGTITDKVQVTQTKKVDGLTLVSYPTEDLAREAGSYQVALKASERWVVQVEAGSRTWILIDPASGDKNETYFNINTTTNNTYEDRTGSITIQSGQLVKTITLKQLGIEPILEIREGAEGLSTTFEGGDVTLAVYCNVEYKVEYPAWMTCKNPNGAPGTNKHVFTIPENETLTDLTGEITVTTLNGKKTLSVPVSQDKHSVLLEIRNVNKYDLDATGADALIQFITNKDWTCKVSEDAQDWMYLNPRDGGKAGNTDLVVSAMLNEAFEDRYGTVTITAGSKEREFTFRQLASAPNISVIDNMPVEAVYQGMNLKVKVSANVDYKIDLPDWITGPTSGSKNNIKETSTLKFVIKENTEYEDRNYDITLYNSEFDVKEVISVRQDMKTDELKAFVSSLSFASKASFSAFDLNSSNNWVAEVSDNWISVSPMSGERGKTPIEVRVSEFDGIDPRTGSITFTCGRASTTIPVTQAPVDAYINVVSGQTQESDYIGKDFDVEVSANTDFSIDLPDWITGPKEGKAGESTLTFTILRNNDYSKRTGTISLYDTKHNANNKITVTQGLKQDVVEVLESFDGILPAEGGKVTIRFTASDSWSIYSNDDLNPTPASGPAGENTVELTIGPNTAIYARNVVVHILCGKVNKPVEISQSKKK